MPESSTVRQPPTSQIMAFLVRRVSPVGLIVALPEGGEGLIRERELGWDAEAKKDWQKRYKPGDTVQAVRLGRSQSGRQELSVRFAQSDPWLDAARRYPVGSLVEGLVTGIMPYGVFVELEPGVTGLLHASRFPSGEKRQPGDIFWPGDSVKVIVSAVDLGLRRMDLSMADLLRRRWPGNVETSSPAREDAGRGARRQATARSLPIEMLMLRGPKSVAVVEDDRQQREAIANWLRHAGQYVVTACDGEEALSVVSRAAPHIVLMDVGMPHLDGIETARQILRTWPEVRCVLMTSWSQADEHRAELDELRATGVALLPKPLLPEDLLDILCDRTEDSELGPHSEPTSVGQVGTRPWTALQSDQAQSILDSLQRLRRSTGATKVVLFALESAQRKVVVVAESGRDPLQPDALATLIHSPVRDVAEDRLRVRLEDASGSGAARFRYLIPLLPFASCIGVPVPGAFRQQYALFLFYSRSLALGTVHEQYAQATAIAVGALLERQQFQAQAIELQRLALLGQLTRALVHEVDHQLSPINFALDALQIQCATIERLAAQSPDQIESEVRQAADMLADLAQGARALTDTARLFGRMARSGQEQIVRPDEIVQEVLDLLHDTADRAHVIVSMESPPGLIFTRAQLSHIQQALLNILLNAIQQIQEARPKDGGHIRIRFARAERDERPLLQVYMEDDGPGIHRQLWERIFELGFTTRNGGSGLGLYITRSLAEAMGGRVYVSESHIMWGTTFAIELPFQL
jgi:signal transduction histidine kinase/predicted RNA-binding protein with RPS1 domain